MQDDLECLLDDERFKHINIQIQRRSERHVRAPEFKDSNVNNLVTSDQADGRRSWVLNEIDVTRREFVGTRQVGFAKAVKRVARLLQ